MVSDKEVQAMIKSFEGQYDVLKEIAEFIKESRETTKMVVNKNENILKEIRRDYENLGKRIAELESYAAMYNCWGYHE
jgi:DNA-binding transcriptional MerR regulator